MKNALFFALAALILTSCQSTTPVKEKTRKIWGTDFLPVIDTHTHTDFTGEKDPMGGFAVTKEEYLKQRQDVGVVASLSHVAGDGAGYNAEMKEKNVFHCFGIGERVDLKALEAGLTSKDYRCIKIYLGYVHRFAADPAYSPVYRMAQKFNVPVVFHTGDPDSSRAKLKYADPLTVDEVAVDFPKVNFVIAHLGNPWIQSAAEVAYKNPNVYLEASAMMIGDLRKVDSANLQKYMVDPMVWAYGYVDDPKKWMYGTDWPLVGMKDFFEAYKKAIPRKDWCAVFYENAIRVFRLTELEGKYECKVTE